MLSVCKTFEFAYAHKLPNHSGKCKNLHGHQGTLEIEIIDSLELRRDFPNDISSEGMIIDFYDLKSMVNSYIIDELDHHYLNDVLDVVPTSENIVMWIVGKLTGIFGPSLIRVRVYESPSSWAEWKKE